MIKKDTVEELRDKIIKLAILQHHKKYVHGQNGPDCFDCAGLIWYVYNCICDINLYSGGIGQSTTTRIMTSNHGKITLFDEKDLNKDLSLINKGDIILFHRQSLNDKEPTAYNKYPGHCGIYLKDNSFIHCSFPKRKVVISNFDKNPYWKEVLVGSINIFDNVKLIKK